MEFESAPMDVDEAHREGTIFEYKSHWWGVDGKINFREVFNEVFCIFCFFMFYSVGFSLMAALGLFYQNFSIKECFEIGAVIVLGLWISSFFLDPNDPIWEEFD